MTAARTIDLREPVPFAGRMVGQITLRPPVMRDYAAIGEPSIVTRSPDGGLVYIENTDAVAGYLRALVPADLAGMIDHLGLADSIRLKDEILSLFGDARSLGVTPAQPSLSPTSGGSPPEISAT